MSLNRKGSRTIWKDTLRKIQWRVSLPEELVTLRAKVSIHVNTIGMLLHNRVTPFNLQFIDCWDSLFSMLENLFRDSGFEKVERREFILEHSQTGRPITFDQI